MKPRDRQSPRRIALFIDFGGLKALLSNTPDSPTIAEFAGRLHTYVSSLGRVVTSTAYADWTCLGDDARTFQALGIESRLVLRMESGDDRSDLVLSLEALETALTIPAIGTFVIASVDASLEEIAVRLRRMGREVIVCGPRRGTANELRRGGDQFVPFELLQSSSASGSTPPTPTREAPATIDFATYDWSRFLRLVNELESRLSFVGIQYLNHKVLNRDNCGFDDRGRRQILINHAIDTGILQTHQIDNIETTGDPVTACRLNRENEIVIRVCGKQAPARNRAPVEKKRED